MADQCFSSQFRFRFEYFLKVRYVWFSFFAHFDYENQLPRLSSNISPINYLLENMWVRLCLFVRSGVDVGLQRWIG